MYSGQAGKDFLALELVAGHVRYSYDVGSSPRTIRVNLRHPVNDNRWHDVNIFHRTLTEHVLRVDNTSKVDVLPDARSVHFDMGDDLYIGGVPKALYSSIAKQVGFSIDVANAFLITCIYSIFLDKWSELKIGPRFRLKHGSL